MKNISSKFSKIMIASVCTITLFSCSKEFLDQKPFTSVVLSEALKSEDDMNTALNGLYSSLRATDLYGRTYAVKGDMMGDLCFLSSSNSGRYLAFNNYNFTKTDSYASSVWLNSYAAIKNANFIINSGIEATKSDNYSQFLSEAYAIRALVYFDLVRNYALPYTVNPESAGVPIVTTIDVNNKPARASVKAVYEQVIADLTKAYALAKFNQGQTMNFLATSKTRTVNSAHMSKFAVRLLMARVYQHMGNWTLAKEAANDVITNSGFTLVASANIPSYWKGTTTTTGKIETMFEVTSDGNNSVSDGTLANLFVPKDKGGSYGDMLATKSFYDSYKATDTRKTLITPGTRSGQLGTANYITKYPIETVNYDDVKIIRFAEAYLILAEAQYNLLDEAGALATLNKFAVTRDPSVKYTTTGTALMDNILDERAKEFAFEGYRFWDLTRLKMTFVKARAQDATNAISTKLTVAPGNINLIFPIPNDEILVNPNVTQNAGY